jgi:hypothetical protein
MDPISEKLNMVLECSVVKISTPSEIAGKTK